MFQAIADLGTSRFRPVMLADIAIVPGMTPLFTDGFFVSIAVTVSFGLTFAAILTIIV